MCCPQEPWLQYSGEASYPPSSSLQSSGAGEIILSLRNLVSSVIKSPISRSSVQQSGSTNHLPDTGERESSQGQWQLSCYPWAVWSLMLTHSPGLFIRVFWPGQVLFYCAHLSGLEIKTKGSNSVFKVTQSWKQSHVRGAPLIFGLVQWWTFSAILRRYSEPAVWCCRRGRLEAPRQQLLYLWQWIMFPKQGERRK